MFVGLDIEFVYYLLHVRYPLRQTADFVLLRRSLHASRDDERAILGRSVDALIVQVFVCFNTGFEIVFDGGVQVGSDRASILGVLAGRTPISLAIV